MIKIGVPYSKLEEHLDIINTREDEAVAFAFGCQLGGKLVQVFMQNSTTVNSNLGKCSNVS